MLGECAAGAAAALHGCNCSAIVYGGDPCMVSQPGKLTLVIKYVARIQASQPTCPSLRHTSTELCRAQLALVRLVAGAHAAHVHGHLHERVGVAGALPLGAPAHHLRHARRSGLDYWALPGRPLRQRLEDCAVSINLIHW